MPAPSSHIDCLPSGLERALLALPQSGAPPPCVRHAATSHARCASSRAQGRSLVARGDDQRCGQAATDWMRCVTRPAHTAPQYASTLCVNQAATGCELHTSYRPLSDPARATARSGPLYACRPAAGPAGYASPTAHRTRYRAKAHGTCAEPHRFCAEGRSSGTAMLYRTSCCPLRVPRRSWPCTLRP